MGCSERQDIIIEDIIISDPVVSDEPAAVESAPESDLTFAEIVGIDLASLPEQVTVGERYIERIENRIPREKTRYEYNGMNQESEFCQAFYKAFEKDKRDFIRLVHTSGDYAEYSFDGRFRPYMEPTDVKDILSQLDFPSIPWKDVPKGIEAARQAYNMRYPEFSYTLEGKRQPGHVARGSFGEFLATLPPDYEPFPPDLVPYRLYQIYRVENSDYTLFRTEGTDLFDPNLQEEKGEFAARFPSQFPTYRHHFYGSKVLHAGGRDYARDNSNYLKDFIASDGLLFVNLYESNFRTGRLGSIRVTRLDTKQPPAWKGFDCGISIYLNPKAKPHFEK